MEERTKPSQFTIQEWNEAAQTNSGPALGVYKQTIIALANFGKTQNTNGVRIAIHEDELFSNYSPTKDTQ
jgi:hypothetical protein